MSICIPCRGLGCYRAYVDRNGDVCPAHICQFCDGAGIAPALEPGECGLDHPNDDCGETPTREMLGEYMSDHAGEPYPPGYYRAETPTVRIPAVSMADLVAGGAKL
jgi:hypothetical protein